MATMKGTANTIAMEISMIEKAEATTEKSTRKATSIKIVNAALLSHFGSFEKKCHSNPTRKRGRSVRKTL